MKTKIIKIGNSLGVRLPKQMIDKLHLKPGDELKIENKESNLEINLDDSEFEEWADTYSEVNIDYRDVLKALAK